jgi:hypothetical protein
VLLADDLVEGLGAVAPVKGRLSGHSAESSGRLDSGLDGVGPVAPGARLGLPAALR